MALRLDIKARESFQKRNDHSFKEKIVEMYKQLEETNICTLGNTAVALFQ